MLSQERNTPARAGQDFEYPVAAATKIFAGGLVVLDSSGNAEPGSTATGKRVVGRAEETADNTAGDAGDMTVKVKSGVFPWGNSEGADEVTQADIGSTAFIVDDETVSRLSSGKSAAGLIVDVDDDGVWVESKPVIISGLAAANNLSDVVSAPAARAQIGANLVVLEKLVPSLVAGAVARLIAPVAGTIARIWSVLEGDELATGNATITAAINGTPVTNGVVTITQAGSALGDIDSATPSAANVVAAGDVITLTVGGTNDDADAFAQVSIRIET